MVFFLNVSFIMPDSLFWAISDLKTENIAYQFTQRYSIMKIIELHLERETIMYTLVKTRN